jgi:hypothetical protein
MADKYPFQMFQEPHKLREPWSVPPGREDERGGRFPPHTHGCIDQVDAYLRALPETDWFHFGD